MTAPASAEFVIVGSGFCGILAARELLRAGREVLVIERGGLLTHEQQLEADSTQLDIPTAAHNNEPAPGSRPYPWSYVYGIGGTSLHWTGVAPRFLPSDFEIRSRYGVGRDWPLSYDELAPFYAEAERSLAVAGSPNPLFPGTRSIPQPAQPYAPVDRLLRSPLKPYFPLPQARPTRPIAGRPACCAAARCALCPVDARYSVLHTLADDDLEGEPGFTLRQRTIAASLRLRGGKVTAVECFDDVGDPVIITGRTIILAASGLENPAILLRSGLGGDDVGRYLFDHSHRLIEMELDHPFGAGRGASLSTGISYAYADGRFRASRGSQIVYPFNPATEVTEGLIRGIAGGRSGNELRETVVDRFQRTMVLDTTGEDLPQRARFVELSPQKDSFGIPLNRINYPADSPYLERSRRYLYRDLPQRLRRQRGRIARVIPAGEGGHILGTCYMGRSDGVVDGNQRHHHVENLYVAGGSAFPSYSAHHPTLTIAALAIRLGQHLASQAAE